MTAIPLPLRQNTPEWEAARQSPDFIGASDVPIITGSSPYVHTSAYDLWAYKTGRLDRLPVDDSTQEIFDLGHALEPVIASRYTAMTGRPLRRVNRTLAHRDVPWAVASLDRVSAVKGERLIVEIKWDPWSRFSRATEGIPPYVIEQVQWQLMVTGYPLAEVAALLGSHVDRYEVAPDPDFQADLLFIVDQFRRHHLLTDTPPPVDGSEATRKAISRLYPNDNGELMEPTAELRALMAELKDAIPAEKAATEEVGRLKNAIRSALGEHSGAETDEWRISFKKGKARRTTDWRALASHYRSMVEAPDEVLDEIESRHITEGEGARPLLPRWAKEEQWT